MALVEVTLDDKYTVDSGRIFLTGIQALVRLPLIQRRIDQLAGLNTAGYITGYRGSPLGSFDQQLVRAADHLQTHHVRFNPGVNEDLAATAAWGTQQARLDGESNYDGVFAMWYGKGPGVDRSGDALRHANLAGTSPHGGVLALLGDDHTCESSTTAHQSEYAMVDAMIPVLNPAGVRELLEFGLAGWAMSRFSGCWVALKCVHDTVEAGASIEVDTASFSLAVPDDLTLPDGGLNIRWPDTPQEQEARLHEFKLDTVRAFCRANRLDRTVLGDPHAQLGIISTGKSYLDVCQALHDLGIDARRACDYGIRVYKVGMSWPLEPLGIREFCQGLDQVIVVEEKRGLLETQVKELLYALDDRPRVVGKYDESGCILFPSAGRLESNQIALAIGSRLLDGKSSLTELRDKLTEIETRQQAFIQHLPRVERRPYFCAGCPHSSSTQVPEGSKALAGIGCHYMAQWMDRDTRRYTQMGAEGASWIGEAPFSTRSHMFQNVGDGTYFHSGLLAIRAAVAAGTNITFKILYNDAVAMTGGQGMDGPLDVPRITRQVHAEGVRRVVVVSDEPNKYPANAGFAPGVSIHHRDALDVVQRGLREVAGTTVLVYDQVCAAEKRRRRKRNTYPDPARRVFINQQVCEGCGDCGVQSNCVAILPVPTEFGRKRAIDQSACNKDFSCLKGFCPSFVTVLGGEPRRGKSSALGSGDRSRDLAPEADSELPAPSLPGLAEPYAVVINGVGGTGVITIGALLSMAAHLEGKGCSILDMTGLAQKGGAVGSHLQFAREPGQLSATRIAPGGADLVLGCDLVVTAGIDTLRTARRDHTQALVNSYQVMPGEFTRDRDLTLPDAGLRHDIRAAVGERCATFFNATSLATALLGDSIAANLLMLGYAYQRGLIPVSAAAIQRAVELNGVAVAMNLAAFGWGRRFAIDPEEVNAVAFTNQEDRPVTGEASDLDSLVQHREAFLRDYQDAAYAQRYRRLVEQAAATEANRVPGQDRLARAVAQNYFKLLAYKDEYEVARLFVSDAFRTALESQFQGDYRLRFHLAPPLLSRFFLAGNRPRTREFGSWVMILFRFLARVRALRGTWLDVFGYSAERRAERALIGEYERSVKRILETLGADNHAAAVAIAEIPDQIRGFGHVKQASMAVAAERAAALFAQFDQRPMDSAA